MPRKKSPSKKRTPSKKRSPKKISPTKEDEVYIKRYIRNKGTKDEEVVRSHKRRRKSAKRRPKKKPSPKKKLAPPFIIPVGDIKRKKISAKDLAKKVHPAQIIDPELRKRLQKLHEAQTAEKRKKELEKLKEQLNKTKFSRGVPMYPKVIQQPHAPIPGAPGPAGAPGAPGAPGASGAGGAGGAAGPAGAPGIGGIGGIGGVPSIAPRRIPDTYYPPSRPYPYKRPDDLSKKRFRKLFGRPPISPRTPSTPVSQLKPGMVLPSVRIPPPTTTAKPAGKRKRPVSPISPTRPRQISFAVPRTISPPTRKKSRPSGPTPRSQLRPGMTFPSVPPDLPSPMDVTKPRKRIKPTKRPSTRRPKPKKPTAPIPPISGLGSLEELTRRRLQDELLEELDEDLARRQRQRLPPSTRRFRAPSLTPSPPRRPRDRPLPPLPPSTRRFRAPSLTPSPPRRPRDIDIARMAPLPPSPPPVRDIREDFPPPLHPPPPVLDIRDEFNDILLANSLRGLSLHTQADIISNSPDLLSDLVTLFEGIHITDVPPVFPSPPSPLASTFPSPPPPLPPQPRTRRPPQPTARPAHPGYAVPPPAPVDIPGRPQLTKWWIPEFGAGTQVPIGPPPPMPIFKTSPKDDYETQKADIKKAGELVFGKTLPYNVTESHRNKWKQLSPNLRSRLPPWAKSPKKLLDTYTHIKRVLKRKKTSQKIKNKYIFLL